MYCDECEEKAHAAIKQLEQDIHKSNIAWAKAADDRDKANEELEKTKLQINAMRPVVEAAVEWWADPNDTTKTIVDLQNAVEAYWEEHKNEKPKGETFPLCECGHNHRTEPGHYTTMNCNLNGCACTYYTEKRKCVDPGPSDVDPMDRTMPVTHNPKLCPHCKQSVEEKQAFCEHEYIVDTDRGPGSFCRKCNQVWLPT